jgi:hypothetical protein
MTLVVVESKIRMMSPSANSLLETHDQLVQVWRCLLRIDTCKVRVHRANLKMEHCHQIFWLTELRGMIVIYHNIQFLEWKKWLTSSLEFPCTDKRFKSLQEMFNCRSQSMMTTARWAYIIIARSIVTIILFIMSCIIKSAQSICSRNRGKGKELSKLE